MRLRSLGQTAALVAASIVVCTSSGYAQITRPGPIVAVAPAPPPYPVERGWIGIGVDLTVSEARRGTSNLIVRVVRTVDGSPAAVAGVVPGDVIRAIDGEPLTLEGWQSFTQNLRRGTDLRLGLDRGGRSREVRLTTAPRPSLAPVPVGFTDLLDSVRTSFQSRLESNSSVWASRDYLALLTAGGSIEEASSRILDQVRQNTVGFRFRAGSAADLMAPSREGGNRYSVVWSTDAALPFEYLMLQSPEADSVKTAIIHLRGELTRSDNERVREDLEELTFRLAEIGSIERENRTQAGRFGADLTVDVRPITARVVGQNFVCGAQVNDLNPQLGSYFGTDRGVLVIQVLSGTPCDEARLLPGDVITQVGDTEIDSVATFRRVLNQVFARSREADLTLLRRGERATATLSR